MQEDGTSVDYTMLLPLLRLLLLLILLLIMMTIFYEVLPHPPYSPDLAPSDFHLFGSLQEFLGGQYFSTDD